VREAELAALLGTLHGFQSQVATANVIDAAPEVALARQLGIVAWRAGTGPFDVARLARATVGAAAALISAGLTRMRGLGIVRAGEDDDDTRCGQQATEG
jgi:hypothetical protein